MGMLSKFAFIFICIIMQIYDNDYVLDRNAQKHKIGMAPLVQYAMHA